MIEAPTGDPCPQRPSPNVALVGDGTGKALPPVSNEVRIADGVLASSQPEPVPCDGCGYRKEFCRCHSGVQAVEGVDVLADGKPLPQSEWERFGIERADLLDAISGTITMFERHGKRIRIERRTPGVRGLDDAQR